MTQDEQAKKIIDDLLTKMLKLAPAHNVKVSIIHDSLEIDGDTEDIKRFCTEIGIPGDITE